MRTFVKLLAAAVFASLPLTLAAQVTVNGGGNYTTIQAAVDAAANGDLVTLSFGNFAEHVVITGKSITLQSTQPSNAAVYPTINGGAAGPAITVSGAAASHTTINGINVTNAGKPQTTGGPHGGIYIINSSPVLENLVLTNNFCEGIYVSNGNPNIYSSKISGTQTTGCAAEEGLGSAIAVNGSDSISTRALAIAGNVLIGNISSIAYSADKGGGGGINITNQTSAVVINNNLIADNVSTGYGGAVYMANTPQLQFTQNVVYGNKGISGGLDIVVPGSSVGAVQGVLSSNTIGYNTATANNAGSDIYIGGNVAQYQLLNNIVVGNNISQASVNCGVTYAGQTITPLVIDSNDFYYASGSTSSPVGGACSSPIGIHGNISKDPLFTNVSSTALANATANFQLQQGSPAIDAGNNSSFPVTSADFAGNYRFIDATNIGYPIIDMGAYEYGTSSPSTDKTDTYLLLTPSTYTPTTGSSVTLTAAFYVNGTGETGKITFYEDGVSLGTGTISTSPDGGNFATFTLPSLTAGTHVFYAVYPGDSAFAPATTAYINLLVQAPTVQNTSVTLSSNPTPTAAIGQTVVLTATVTNAASGGTTPAGKVYFLDNGAIINTGGTAINTSTGVGTYNGTFAQGVHTLTAAFVPTDTTDYNGAVSNETVLTVAGAQADAVLTVAPTSSTYGDPVVLTATVSPGSGTLVPTGSVSFYDGTSPLGSGKLTSGTSTSVASLTLNSLSGGSHALTCTYSGDTSFGESSCNTVNTTVAAAASTLTLSSSANPVQALTSFTVTAKLTATNSGNALPNTVVTLHQTGAADQSATTNSSGLAAFIVAGAVPSASFTAASTATSSAAAATGSLTVQVLPNATSATLIVQPTTPYEGQTLTAVASILDTSSTAPPAGSVALYDGLTLISTLNLPPGTASNPLNSVTFPVSTLSVGGHNLTIVYTPTPNFLTSESGPITITVLPSSFTLAADPASITIQTEHHKALNLNLTSIGAFSGNVELSCAGPLPPVLTCTFGKQVVTLTPGGTTSTTLSLETDAIPNFYALLPLVLLPLAATRRRRRKLGLLCALALAAILPLNGCSGHYPNHTPPGTYDIVLTATGTTPGATQSTTKTVHLTLIVTP